MTRSFEIKQGLDLPIQGAPVQTVGQAGAIRHVAIVGDDYVGMKPTMEVAEGDRVKLGQLVFTDKKTEGVKYTAPGAGTVVAVNRGAKRKFESLVIELDGDESGESGEVTFASYPNDNLAMLAREKVQQNLVDSGLWTTLRTRPYSKVPLPGSTPEAIFVTAIDTEPLAADPAVSLSGYEADFIAGLESLSTLTDGPTYLCKAAGAVIPGEDSPAVETAEFAGPHPAGLPGTHIHFLHPVHMERTVWYVNYQDVVAIGRLMLTGHLIMDRVISIAGPVVKDPRLVRTRVGASLEEIVEGEYLADEGKKVRVISGSVLSGRKAGPMTGYLGRRHLQVSMLEEGDHRDLLGWALPGFDRYSTKKTFVSAWLSDQSRKWRFTTSSEGSHRAIVPLGMYERVMPLDIIPTPLLKALCVQDTEYVQMLGALELDEEDLALCTFVCPSKNDYGPMLRQSLTTIELEG